MSAFIVSKEHIDALVHTALFGPRECPSACRWSAPVVFNPSRVMGIFDADKIGQMLWSENFSSVNYRYRDNEPIELYRYTMGGHSKRWPVIEALKHIQCYEYQTCEHPQWEASDAKRLCESLRDRLVSHLPGWDAAPWGL